MAVEHVDEQNVCHWTGCLVNGPFASSKDLWKHVDETHVPTTRGPQCHVCVWEECGKSFTKKYNFRSHLSSHISNLVLFECNLCGYGTRFRHDLRKHASRIHGASVDSNGNVVAGGAASNGTTATQQTQKNTPKREHKPSIASSSGEHSSLISRQASDLYSHSSGSPHVPDQVPISSWSPADVNSFVSETLHMNDLGARMAQDGVDGIGLLSMVDPDQVAERYGVTAVEAEVLQSEVDDLVTLESLRSQFEQETASPVGVGANVYVEQESRKRRKAEDPMDFLASLSKVRRKEDVYDISNVYDWDAIFSGVTEMTPDELSSAIDNKRRDQMVDAITNFLESDDDAFFSTPAAGRVSSSYEHDSSRDGHTEDPASFNEMGVHLAGEDQFLPDLEESQAYAAGPTLSDGVGDFLSDSSASRPGIAAEGGLAAGGGGAASTSLSSTQTEFERTLALNQQEQQQQQQTQTSRTALSEALGATQALRAAAPAPSSSPLPPPAPAGLPGAGAASAAPRPARGATAPNRSRRRAAPNPMAAPAPMAAASPSPLSMAIASSPSTSQDSVPLVEAASEEQPTAAERSSRKFGASFGGLFKGNRNSTEQAKKAKKKSLLSAKVAMAEPEPMEAEQQRSLETDAAAMARDEDEVIVPAMVATKEEEVAEEEEMEADYPENDDEDNDDNEREVQVARELRAIYQEEDMAADSPADTSIHGVLSPDSARDESTYHAPAGQSQSPSAHRDEGTGVSVDRTQAAEAGRRIDEEQPQQRPQTVYAAATPTSNAQASTSFPVGDHGIHDEETQYDLERDLSEMKPSEPMKITENEVMADMTPQAEDDSAAVSERMDTDDNLTSPAPSAVSATMTRTDVDDAPASVTPTGTISSSGAAVTAVKDVKHSAATEGMSWLARAAANQRLPKASQPAPGIITAAGVIVSQSPEPVFGQTSQSTAAAPGTVSSTRQASVGGHDPHQRMRGSAQAMSMKLRGDKKRTANEAKSKTQKPLQEYADDAEKVSPPTDWSDHSSKKNSLHGPPQVSKPKAMNLFGLRSMFTPKPTCASSINGVDDAHRAAAYKEYDPIVDLSLKLQKQKLYDEPSPLQPVSKVGLNPISDNCYSAHTERMRVTLERVLNVLTAN
eukprot:Clim_evm9s143 gene=Clim_evmTU9s143